MPTSRNLLKILGFAGLLALGWAPLLNAQMNSEVDPMGNSTGAPTQTQGTQPEIPVDITNRNYKEIPNNKQDEVTLRNTMNFASCHEYNANITIKICILMGSKRTADNVCYHPQNPISCIASWDGKYDYWEPSELIEVSCRKGYSLLLPQGVGAIPKAQACAGPLKSSGGRANRWFFDTRVWAINGGSGQAREQAAGSTLRKQATVCGGNHPLVRLEGYAKKFDMFSRGGGNGPGGSWEAYISDYDQSWSKDANNYQTQTPPAEQKCSGISVPNCWGPIPPLMGWATHPHQPVAAALVAWRGHTRAQGKVSPALSGGYKIEMDYPFIMRNSPFGSSMGLPGGSGGGGGGGVMGSACFQPGDPGPWWFTTGQTQTLPESIPGIVSNMKHGDTAQIADLHAGVYIFTVWVKTSCELFVGVAGTDVQNAMNDCRDKQHY